jgi:hypothetical protein
MIYSRFNNLLPNFSVGFPLEMYNQFEVKGECNEKTLLHGSHFINILYNMIICIITMVLINKKQQTKNNKNE